MSQTLLLFLAPILVLATMVLIFNILSQRFERKQAYFIGFVFYWGVWCIGLPIVLMGTAQVLQYFAASSGSPLGEPGWLGLICLVAPLVLSYGYAFPRAMRSATWQIVAMSAGLAIVNGICEEVLWRGAFSVYFGNSAVLGMIYPAIGFAVWHFAPQVIFPNKSPGGSWSLVIVAGIVGLMWAWVANTTGTILWVTLSHILFDFAGLGGRVYLAEIEPVAT